MHFNSKIRKSRNFWTVMECNIHNITASSYDYNWNEENPKVLIYEPSGVCRKVSWGVHSVAYDGLSVFGVRCLWRHNLTSYSCFQTNVLAKFVDTIRIFFYIHSPYFMCHWTEYKLSALQVRISEENKLNATTQQFITAKIWGCVSKQGNETHSSMPQRNL